MSSLLKLAALQVSNQDASYLRREHRDLDIIVTIAKIEKAGKGSVNYQAYLAAKTADLETFKEFIRTHPLAVNVEAMLQGACDAPGISGIVIIDYLVEIGALYKGIAFETFYYGNMDLTRYILSNGEKYNVTNDAERMREHVQGGGFNREESKMIELILELNLVDDQDYNILEAANDISTIGLVLSRARESDYDTQKIIQGDFLNHFMYSYNAYSGHLDELLTLNLGNFYNDFDLAAMHTAVICRSMSIIEYLFEVSPDKREQFLQVISTTKTFGSVYFMIQRIADIFPEILQTFITTNGEKDRYPQLFG